MKKRDRNEAGWTLLELVLVIAVLGVLAIFAMEHFFDLRAKAQEKSEAYVIGSVQAGIDVQQANEVLHP